MTSISQEYYWYYYTTSYFLKQLASLLRRVKKSWDATGDVDDRRFGNYGRNSLEFLQSEIKIWESVPENGEPDECHHSRYFWAYFLLDSCFYFGKKESRIGQQNLMVPAREKKMQLQVTNHNYFCSKVRLQVNWQTAKESNVSYDSQALLIAIIAWMSDALHYLRSVGNKR